MSFLNLFFSSPCTNVSHNDFDVPTEDVPFKKVIFENIDSIDRLNEINSDFVTTECKYLRNDMLTSQYDTSCLIFNNIIVAKVDGNVVGLAEHERKVTIDNKRFVYTISINKTCTKENHQDWINRFLLKGILETLYKDFIRLNTLLSPCTSKLSIEFIILSDLDSLRDEMVNDIIIKRLTYLNNCNDYDHFDLKDNVMINGVPSN